MTWTEEDIRVASVIGGAFPNAYVIEVIKENSVTETTVGPDAEAEGIDWSDAEGAVSFPETPDNPHNHTYTWSPKLPDGSMLVIRAGTAQALVDATEAMAPYAARLRAAWAQVLGGGAAGQGPGAPAHFANPQGATPPPFGPNVSVPGAPGYVGPQAPAAPQWGAPQQGGFQPAQQGGGFNGGSQQGGGGGNKPQPKQCPPGWYRTDKNSGPGSDFWKTWRESNQQALKGKIQWGGASTFWVAPDVAAMVNGAGFIVVAGA